MNISHSGARSLAPAEQQALSCVVESLQERFPEVGDALIVEAVDRARGRYAGAPIRDFVAVMVERDVVAELGAAAAPPAAR
jgi:hypothetical protein